MDACSRRILGCSMDKHLLQDVGLMSEALPRWRSEHTVKSVRRRDSFLLRPTPSGFASSNSKAWKAINQALVCPLPGIHLFGYVQCSVKVMTMRKPNHGLPH